MRRNLQSQMTSRKLGEVRDNCRCPISTMLLLVSLPIRQRAEFRNCPQVKPKATGTTAPAPAYRNFWSNLRGKEKQVATEKTVLSLHQPLDARGHRRWRGRLGISRLPQGRRRHCSGSCLATREASATGPQGGQTGWIKRCPKLFPDIIRASTNISR